MSRSDSRTPELAAAAEAEAAYRAAYAEAERLRHLRNEAIRGALRRHTHAEVARVTGLTRGRVGQISAAGDH